MSGEPASYASTPTVVPASASPPIARAIPLISKSLLFARSSIAVVASKLTSSFYRPTSALLLVAVPFILYLFSPAIAFVEIALHVLLFMPYNLAVYFFDAFQPLYVFFGLACICGILLGIGGRLLVWILSTLILRPRQQQGSIVVQSENLANESARYRKKLV